MADRDPSKDRPTFARFWKRSKQAAARKITFVSSSPAGAASSSAGVTNPAAASGGGDDDAEPSQAQGQPASDRDKERAQNRRAQVRKAQIQHRQRKANYVKQLEMDIAGFRAKISTAEWERSALRAENEAIRARLGADVAQAAPAMTEPMFADIDFDEFTMGLGVDELMGGTPVFQITGEPSSDNATSQASPGMSPPWDAGQPDLTPEQTQQAINFILALEHICWNHVTQASLNPEGDPSADHSGHAMMATSLALQKAPPGLFEAIGRTEQNLRDSKRKGKHKEHKEAAPHDVSWLASGLTLQSLHGLASSLNSPDRELTPVQAWFELAGRYPRELLLRQDTMDGLKGAFCGVVRCSAFGAVMERGAFESIVGRIIDAPSSLGSEPAGRAADYQQVAV